jgi:hypothetical protein
MDFRLFDKVTAAGRVIGFFEGLASIGIPKSSLVGIALSEDPWWRPFS